MGSILMSELSALRSDFPATIAEVRGYGLMVGMELTRDAEPVVAAMRDRKILVNGTDQTVLRFLPPLIIQEEHIRTTVRTLAEILGNLPA